MSQTRRLAAILAADVAGYSRLMGADEEGTLERLKALRRELIDPKIAEHRGRIVKTTGDGLLVEFPSVVDAVRCAVVVQQAMAERNTGLGPDSRIELRIGINLGDVIVEGNDLYGDGVNIAARVEALADAGGVFVSNTVHDHVRDRLPFALEDLGEQQVKNIARPVRVYRVRDTGAAKRRSTPALPLPDKPSIAVLPFANMSGDPEQEYISPTAWSRISSASDPASKTAPKSEGFCGCAVGGLRGDGHDSASVGAIDIVPVSTYVGGHGRGVVDCLTGVGLISRDRDVGPVGANRPLISDQRDPTFVSYPSWPVCSHEPGLALAMRLRRLVADREDNGTPTGPVCSRGVCVVIGEIASCL